MTQQYPAGWYTQPDGSSRYWDGTQWAEPVAPAAQATVARKRPWYTKKRVIIPVVAFLGLIAILPKGGDDQQAAPLASTSASATVTPSSEPAEESTPEAVVETTDAAPAEPAVVETTPAAAPETTTVEPIVEEPAEPALSVTQDQAVRKAQSYLDFSAFSRTGLIDQLEYEGFSAEDATFGVDALGADWAEQAMLKAESYLEFTAFSESGLVDQLDYEGFTPEEAQYGVANITVDWSEQAALKAESYLELTAFSRCGLIDQLIYEGFSQAQAEFRADSVGL